MAAALDGIGGLLAVAEFPTTAAEDYLRESASPYTLPALISALDDVITMLTRATRVVGHSLGDAAGPELRS